MAKKTITKQAKGGTSGSDLLAASIVEVPLEEEITARMHEYGTMTVENRAIPDFRDGLKPVHRRILWAMYSKGLKSSSGFRKCAKVVGDTMGEFHPHGNNAIYDALCNMVTAATPFISGQGNFGWYIDPPAADRYTECRLHPQGERLLLDPYYLAVTDMVPNYDSSSEEPVILPAMLPLSLVTNSQGIAVGTTTHIPSFTLDSVHSLIDAILKRAAKSKSKPECTAKDCFNHLEFSSKYGGYPEYAEDKELMDIYKTGVGKLAWRCDGAWDDKRKAYLITGFAPMWNVENKIAAISNVQGVKGAVDISSDEGICVEVRLQGDKKDTATIAAIEKLLYSQLNYRTNVIEKHKIDDRGLASVRADFDAVSIVEIVNRWLVWRAELEVRALKAEKDRVNKDLAREELLAKAIANIAIIFKLLQTKGIDKVAELQKRLKITKEDSQYIWSLAVGRLDKLSETSNATKIRELKGRIKEIDAAIKTPYTSVAANVADLID